MVFQSVACRQFSLLSFESFWILKNRGSNLWYQQRGVELLTCCAGPQELQLCFVLWPAFLSASSVERHFRSWRENEGRYYMFFPLAPKANQLTLQGIILSPFQVLLIFMFNLTISTSNMLLVNTGLWTWTKSVRSVWFLVGFHSDFWSTFMQVKMSLFLLPLLKKMLPVIILPFQSRVVMGQSHTVLFTVSPYQISHQMLPFQKKTTPKSV